MTNQQTKVISYLNKSGSITSLEAIKYLGITRLSAVIFDLKDKGYDIDGKMIWVKNRFGEDCRVKRYFIKGRKTSFWETLKNFAKGE